MNISVTIKLEMAQEHCNYAFDTQRNLPLRCTECIERHGVNP